MDYKLCTFFFFYYGMCSRKIPDAFPDDSNLNMRFFLSFREAIQSLQDRKYLLSSNHSYQFWCPYFKVTRAYQMNFELGTVANYVDGIRHLWLCIRAMYRYKKNVQVLFVDTNVKYQCTDWCREVCWSSSCSSQVTPSRYKRWWCFTCIDMFEVPPASLTTELCCFHTATSPSVWPSVFRLWRLKCFHRSYFPLVFWTRGVRFHVRWTHASEFFPFRELWHFPMCFP